MVRCAVGQGPILAASSGGQWVSVGGEFETSCWIQPSVPMAMTRLGCTRAE